jgi:uncharacterized protein (DUF427 family)
MKCDIRNVVEYGAMDRDALWQYKQPTAFLRNVGNHLQDHMI